MVTCFGMSPALGPVTIGEAGGEVFLGDSLQDLGSVGPHTLDVIDDETERIVEEAKERALHVLRANWAVGAGDRAARCSSTRRSPGWRSTRCSPPVEKFDMGDLPLPERGVRRNGDS